MSQETPIPRYYQITHSLEQRLYNNHYPPGERFLSEKELEISFGVSRITARRALEELKKKGLVTRHRGKGTYVATNFEKPNFPKFTGSLDQLFMVGIAGVVKEATIEQVVAPPKVALALQLKGPNAYVTRIQRVLSLHGTPHTYHQSFYPQSIGKKIQKQDLFKHPLLELLEREFHIAVVKVYQVIEAAVADTELADRLEVSFGSPLLYVERTLLTKNEIPIGFAHAYYRGDSYRISVTLVD